MHFIDLQAQYRALKEEINANIQTVLDEGVFIGGRFVAELEEKMAAYVGRKHCITCGNGTDALQTAYMALGIGEGDGVFCPDCTFIASVEPAHMLGATPVFCDVSMDSYNIDPQSLERQIQAVLAEGKLTPKVVVAVDFLGNPCDYDAIEAMLLDQTVPEDEGVSTKAAELRPAPAAQRPVPAEPDSQGGRVESRAAALYGAISATAKDQQPGQTSPQDEAAGHLPADGNEKTSNKAGSAAALIQDKGSLPIQDEGSIPPQDESQDQAELKLFSAKPAGNSAESEASASSDDSAISAAPATNAPAIAPAAAEQDQAAEDGLSQSAAGSKPAYNVANIPAADHEKSPDAASRLYQDSMASLNKNQAAPTAESKDTPEPASDGDETTPLPPKQPHSSAQAGNGADSDNSAAGAENKAASTQTQPPAAEEDGKIQPDTDRTESADSHDRALGIRMEPHPDHPFLGRCHTRLETVPGRKPMPSGYQPAQSVPSGKSELDAIRKSLSD